MLLANGNESNLILSKFARPIYCLFIYFFISLFTYLFIYSHQLFDTCRSKYFLMKTVNNFAFLLATFSLQNITCLDAGLDGKI